MGQKVNPIGLRLILNKNWQSKWYANKKEFGNFLQEDIKIRNNSVTYTHGDQITADNSKTPTYLLTDTTIRSTDYEHEFSLSHDIVNKKTTITLTNTPSSTSKIRVERKHDKYLVFKQKGIN